MINIQFTFHRFYVYVDDGRFEKEVSGIDTGEWTHMVFTFLGSNDGQGIIIYANGVNEGADGGKFDKSYRPGDAITVVGRAYSDINTHYASFEMDELAFFNKKLLDDQILEMYRIA